jgi:hypothetical protein
MKNMPLYGFIVIFSFLFGACDPFCTIHGSGNVADETRDLPAFDRISLGGSGHVFLRVGEPQKVMVRADDNILSIIETKVENGKLHIGLRPGCSLYRYSKMEIYITIPGIRELSVSGSGHMEAADTLVSEDLVFRISGSGSLEAAIRSDEMKASVSGAGDLFLSGNAHRVDANISGSGKIKAFDLSCEQADMSISGSGDSYITVREELAATVSGSGRIRYRGSPRLDIRVSGSGSVRQDNQ